MARSHLRHLTKAASLVGAVMLAFVLATAALLLARDAAQRVFAAPIPPPEGYPKLSLSAKLVSPGLVHTGGEKLTYRLELRNTGAWAAEGVAVVDILPPSTQATYDAGSAASSVPPAPVVSAGSLTWTGDVGFDSVVVISYSMTVAPAFSGVITNTAVVNHALIPEPVQLTAEALVSDDPVLEIQKSALPKKPGPGKTLSYSLEVTNIGQPATDLPVTVTDQVPQNTTVHAVGADGEVSPNGREVTWSRVVSLETGASSVFTFSVDVGSVASGTVIINDDYQVESSATGVAAGEPHTITVVDPEFFLSKTTWPDPPGSNRELTYTLTVLNRGSLATDLVVTDQLPAGVVYRRGGVHQNGVVRWTLPELDTGETAKFTFTVYVGDVAEVTLFNNNYQVCSAEGVCQAGVPLESLVKGPTFLAKITLEPVAKKPGSGQEKVPVTPTIVIQNMGPGAALDLTAQLIFGRISVSNKKVLVQYPVLGEFFDGPDCPGECRSYLWVGDLAVGQAVTLTTVTGQSTIGGDEGTHYTATVVITDVLSAYTTEPYSATAIGHVTHLANLIPVKTAPEVIGAGQEMTYTIDVYNSGLSTEEPPYPVLTETLPASVTLVRVSDGGEVTSVGGSATISWTLPAMSPGDHLSRTFSVLVDPDLVSGTLLINDQYGTMWYESEVTGTLSMIGEPVTTTVKEVGLIDSFKTVNPALARPGPDNVLTYTVHVVNSSPVPLSGVHVYDLMPWEHSTYQRDAIVSAGSLVSDIISLDWTGSVAAYSEELITFTVLVDPGFSGVLTNTATIEHPSLIEPISVTAVAYITDQPVLRLSKTATPNPVGMGEELTYKLLVQNLGQMATLVTLTDTLPSNVSYVVGSATAGGKLQGDTMSWMAAVLEPGETKSFTFKVTVLGGRQVVNDRYRVSCAEGVSAVGKPVITEVDQQYVYLPLIRR